MNRRDFVSGLALAVLTAPLAAQAQQERAGKRVGMLSPPEPFTALDDRAIAVLQTVLREALARHCTIVLSTHQLREALELATHVALLNRGALAYHGERTAEMLADPGWLYARYGESG